MECSAEAVLARAPKGWTRTEEGHLRKRLWNALRDDNAGHMWKALRMYSTESTHPWGGWDLPDLLVRLRLALWAKSAGKRGKRRGLLHAAACNESGVPYGGAVRCVAKLLEVCPPGPGEAWQLRTAIADCERLGRQDCLALLRPALTRTQQQCDSAN